jgi:hypothetical protein
MTEASNSTERTPDRRKLIAVIYMDMVGYSRLIGLDDRGTLERLRILRRNLIDPAIARCGICGELKGRLGAVMEGSAACTDLGGPSLRPLRRQRGFACTPG